MPLLMPKDFISDLAQILTPKTPDKIGWLFPALVCNTSDPLSLHRIKVELPAKDGNPESDWLFYCSPSPSINLDLPPLGSIAVCGYLDADLTQGFWLGILISQSTRLPFSPNDGDIVINPPGNVHVVAEGNHVEIRSRLSVDIEATVSEASIHLIDNGDVEMRSGLLNVNVRDLA